MQAIFSPPSVAHGPDSSMTVVHALPQSGRGERSLGGESRSALVVQDGGSEVGWVGEGKNREMKNNGVDGERDSGRNVGLQKEASAWEAAPCCHWSAFKVKHCTSGESMLGIAASS